MKKIILAATLIITAASASAADFCKGTTKAGKQCSRKAGENGYCYQHTPNAHHCQGTTKAGQPCKIVVKEGKQFCAIHSK